MFKLQALFTMKKFYSCNSFNITMATTKKSAAPVTATATAATKTVNVSLLLLIPMAYLICPIVAWMPDVRPDLQSSKYICHSCYFY